MKPEYVTLGLRSGTNIVTAAKKAIQVAVNTKCKVRFTFNNITIETDGRETESEIAARYKKIVEAKQNG